MCSCHLPFLCCKTIYYSHFTDVTQSLKSFCIYCSYKLGIFDVWDTSGANSLLVILYFASSQVYTQFPAYEPFYVVSLLFALLTSMVRNVDQVALYLTLDLKPLSRTTICARKQGFQKSIYDKHSKFQTALRAIKWKLHILFACIVLFISVFTELLWTATDIRETPQTSNDDADEIWTDVISITQESRTWYIALQYHQSCHLARF